MSSWSDSRRPYAQDFPWSERQQRHNSPGRTFSQQIATDDIFRIEPPVPGPVNRPKTLLTEETTRVAYHAKTSSSTRHPPLHPPSPTLPQLHLLTGVSPSSLQKSRAQHPEAATPVSSASFSSASSSSSPASSSSASSSSSSPLSPLIPGIVRSPPTPPTGLPLEATVLLTVDDVGRRRVEEKGKEKASEIQAEKEKEKEKGKEKEKVTEKEKTKEAEVQKEKEKVKSKQTANGQEKQNGQGKEKGKEKGTEKGKEKGKERTSKQNGKESPKEKPVDANKQGQKRAREEDSPSKRRKGSMSEDDEDSGHLLPNEEYEQLLKDQELNEEDVEESPTKKIRVEEVSSFSQPDRASVVVPSPPPLSKGAAVKMSVDQFLALKIHLIEERRDGKEKIKDHERQIEEGGKTPFPGEAAIQHLLNAKKSLEEYAQMQKSPFCSSFQETYSPKIEILNRKVEKILNTLRVHSREFDVYKGEKIKELRKAQEDFQNWVSSIEKALETNPPLGL